MRALHPDIAALMTAIQEAGVAPLGSQAPSLARLSYSESRRRLQPDFDAVTEVIDWTIPGATSIPARFYRGVGEDAAACLLFLHGGGWVLGDLDSHEGICRRLAAKSGCSVLAIDYRLAPEHPFPAALEDSAVALRWMADQAPKLNIDRARIAVGGDSAGGNLAAVLALMARDKLVPSVAFQVLLYPATDLTMESDSYERVTKGVMLTADSMRYFIGHYLRDAEQSSHWQASPLRASSVAGTAPALVLTCGHDPLCSEGQRYAERLEREGVPVTALHMSDQAHGILNLGRAVSAATPILDFAAAMLKQALRAEHSNSEQKTT